MTTEERDLKFAGMAARGIASAREAIDAGDSRDCLRLLCYAWWHAGHVEGGEVGDRIDQACDLARCSISRRIKAAETMDLVRVP